MNHRSAFLRPYAGSFLFGWREGLGNRAGLVSALVVFATLAILFDAIFRMMPMDRLPLAGLTPAHLLWHFLFAEVIIVSAPGLSAFGRMIAAGRLSEFAARPVGLAGFVISYLMGQHLSQALVLLVGGVAVLGLLPGRAPPLSAGDWAALPLALILSALLFNMATFLVGVIERRGPYSRPLSWLVMKLMFTLGGLFFPVLLFPDWLKAIVLLTPFPAVALGAGGLALPGVAQGLVLGMELFWAGVLAALVLLAERRLLAGLLEHGE